MDAKIIQKNSEKIIDLKRTIEIIESERENTGVNIELRIFTKGGWNNIDYNPKHKPSMNYVICQLILDLKNQIKECEEIIKKEVKI